MLGFFRTSLRNLFAAVITTCAILTAVVVGTLGYQRSRDAIMSIELEKMEVVAQSRELALIQTFALRKIELELLAGNETLAHTLSGQTTGQITDSLLDKARAGHFHQIYVVDLRGKVVESSDRAEVGKDFSGEAWFKEARTETVIGNLNAKSGTIVYTIATPMRIDGELGGLLLAEIEAKDVLELLGDHNGLGNSGESYLIGKDGTLLTPSRFVQNAEFSLKNTQGAFLQFSSGNEGGGLWPDYRNAPVIGHVMFKELSEEVGLEWALVVEIDEAEAMMHALTLRNQTVLITVAIALLIMLVGYYVAKSISEPIVQLAAISEAVAKGDLSVSVRDSGRRDEIGVLERGFQSMVTGLREILGNMQQGVSQLSTSAAEIAATAKQSSSSAAEQAATVAEVGTTAEEIKQTSRSAADSAQMVVQASEQAMSQGQDGLDAVNESVEVMRVISERVENVAARILDLNAKNSQIGEIVESVSDLAEQSNLLAVNASIEAAKAGEHGRGFAVVASEVRSLAEQSKRAAQQIRGILVDIQKATESAVMATEEGNKRVVDGRKSVEGVRAVVQELASVLDDSASKARQIAGAANQQAIGVSQIASAMDDVAKVGKDTAQGAAQLEKAAADLSALSRQLDASVRRFRI